jgi:hypothetical protein
VTVKRELVTALGLNIASAALLVAALVLACVAMGAQYPPRALVDDLGQVR